MPAVHTCSTPDWDISKVLNVDLLYTVSQKTWCRIFCNNFLSCWLILKIVSLLETAMNYLQNKYNIFRYLLKTSLYYHVKHKSLQTLQLHYHSLVTELSAPPFKRKHVTLLAYLLSSSVYPVTSSRSWGTVGRLTRPSMGAECSW